MADAVNTTARPSLQGFARHGDGSCRTIASIDELRDAWSDPAVEVWLDYCAPEAAELSALAEVIPLDSDALEDCLSGEQRPRIDEFEDAIFIVLYGLLGPERAEVDPRKLAVFVGERFLISVHRAPLRTIADLRDRAAKRTAAFLAEGLDTVLHLIVDAMVDSYVLVADRFADRIEELEDVSLDPDCDDNVMSAAAELRREVLELRRLANAQRELLMPIARGAYDYVDAELKQEFSHVRDHLTQVLETCDALRDQLAGVRENYRANLSHRTNEIMKTLTIVATIMLPLSLVAGIYGMNLTLWPDPAAPASFWIVMGGMLAIGGGLVWFMRRRGWL